MSPKILISLSFVQRLAVWQSPRQLELRGYQPRKYAPVCAEYFSGKVKVAGAELSNRTRARTGASLAQVRAILDGTHTLDFALAASPGKRLD
jgi:hypothetical protein